jgi:hypothetical protein
VDAARGRRLGITSRACAVESGGGENGTGGFCETAGVGARSGIGGSGKVPLAGGDGNDLLVGSTGGFSTTPGSGRGCAI